MTVCYYHVTYAFQSKSTTHGCLNIKQLLTRNMRNLWSLSNSNGIRTRNHFIDKPLHSYRVQIYSETRA